jgi:hypothetical protein
VHGRRGEPHLAGELGVAGPPVGAEQVDQLPVDGVDGALTSRGAPLPRSSIAADVLWSAVGLDSVEGEIAMAFLVVLVLVVAVVVLVMRATAAGGPGGLGMRPQVRPRPRPTRSGPPLAPDDDPEFLRELERRTRRDDGSPA